jgi:autotransporter-associated beta strand protein
VSDLKVVCGVNNSGSITKSGDGILELTAGNTYSGLTNINTGTLLAANNTALGAGGFNGTSMSFIYDGATLALQGGISLDEHFHVWGSGVGGLGAVRSISGNNALTSSYLGGAGYNMRSSSTVGVDADTLSISGFYEEGGSFSLTKVGAGTLRFTGTSSNYTGGTMIDEGTVIAGAGGVAKGAVTIASGATLSTTSATSTGLAALYYNNSVSQANIANLPTLLNHFGANSPVPSLVQTAPTMNFGNNGSGFPSPYNSGATGFEAFYSGKINIATAGTYTFNTSSDDGSMLFINGVAAVTNNFDQGYPGSTKTGSITLGTGMHDIVIAYNQGGGGYGMNAQMSGADDTNMVDINTGNASITPDLVVGSLAGAGNVTLTTGNLITGIDNGNTSFSGTISGIGSVTKFGSGVQTLTGTLSYGGSTSVQGGTLAVVGSLPAASTVTVGSGGTLNPGTVGATGILNAGTTNITGTLAIDLDATSSDRLAVTGNLDITGSTLAINPLAVPAATPYTVATYSGTLTGSFVSPPSGYTVNYGTGTNSAITITKSSSDYDTWAGPSGYNLSQGSSGDDDGDGYTNFEEYAFGLIPNSGSSVNPITSQLIKSTKKFSYTRRKPSLGTNLNYSVWFSDNLVGWTQDTGATEGTAVPSGDNETVEVTLSVLPGDPLPAKLFIQVRAN